MSCDAVRLDTLVVIFFFFRATGVPALRICSRSLQLIRWMELGFQEEQERRGGD